MRPVLKNMSLKVARCFASMENKCGRPLNNRRVAQLLLDMQTNQFHGHEVEIFWVTIAGKDFLWHGQHVVQAVIQLNDPQYNFEYKEIHYIVSDTAELRKIMKEDRRL